MHIRPPAPDVWSTVSWHVQCMYSGMQVLLVCVLMLTAFQVMMFGRNTNEAQGEAHSAEELEL